MKSKTILVLGVVALVLGLMCAVFCPDAGATSTETTAGARPKRRQAAAIRRLSCSRHLRRGTRCWRLGTLTGMGAMNGAEQSGPTTRP